MAKVTAISFLVLVLIICSLQGRADAARGGSWPVRGKALAADDIISTACGDTFCTAEFYNTSYVTCESNPGETLPAYSNCCVLHSCMPEVSTCTLHLNNDEGTVACNF